ncbi:hypothetical protein RB7714 [Rhodopirellula baltica SH 1]|uniref:Uncharacterized protein n=1 Tax=Rhodopirellula baltica (strain DSM 10527 / NCIMB 13988 / SH1) TaxID=243090 RepID=Q7UN92_RHOBA|nr:hypothetical protein RB7714 [Rhodopirellula baltica SH 1]
MSFEVADAASAAELVNVDSGRHYGKSSWFGVSACQRGGRDVSQESDGRLINRRT